MKRISASIAALALIAAAPLQTTQTVSRPATPGYAATTEPCLIEPPLTLWPEEPPELGPGPNYWSDCSTGEAAEAIQRQCALDEQPGTIAHEMCVEHRAEVDANRRAALAAESSPTSGTSSKAADRACRGQSWRRPGESRQDCIARLVATDALSQPLPEGRQSTGPRCRRESTRNEDGTGFSFSVTCEETTVSPASPRR